MFLGHLLSCNSQRVVQISGQVGTLPFDVAGVPGVQRVLGHGTLYRGWDVSVLLPGAKRKGDERKHNQLQNQTELRTGHPHPRAHTHILNRIPEPNRKAASNYIKMYHTAKSICK